MNETIHLILTIFQVIICAALVGVVLLQSGKDAGLSGAISGSSVTFFGKNKGRSLDAKLERATGWLGACFIVLTLILLLLN